VKLTLGQIADWIHAEGVFDTNAEALGYSIDSRTIAAGDLFFPGQRQERVCFSVPCSPQIRTLELLSSFICSSDSWRRSVFPSTTTCCKTSVCFIDAMTKSP